MNHAIRILYITKANLALRRAHTRNIKKTVEALNALPGVSCALLQNTLWRRMFRERNNFDILYFRDHRLFALAFAARFLLRKNIIHEIHSTHGFYFLRYLSFLVSHGVVFLTKKLRRHYNKSGRKPSIVVHGNGVDFALFDKVPEREQGTYRVVYTGSARWYALDVLVAMMTRLPVDTMLVLIGLKDEEAAGLRVKAEKVGVGGRVELNGRVSAEEIPQHLLSADVLANPLGATLPGSISVKLYEYFAAGRPIVSTLGGANDEILRDGENCLVAELTPESFAEKIMRIRGDRELAERISRGAKEDAKKYTWEKRARRIADFIINGGYEMVRDAGLKAFLAWPQPHFLESEVGQKGLETSDPAAGAGENEHVEPFHTRHTHTRKLILLGYHSIDGEKTHLSVSRKMFEKQLLYLKRKRYTFLQFRDLLEIKEGKRPMPKNPVLIYFDDGYRDNFFNAYPILKKHAIPAALFLVVRYVEEGPPLYLSWDEVRAMRDVFEFGTHTMTHRKLTGLSADEARYELEQSRAIIEEKTNQRVLAISYPKSRWNEEVRTIADELGFEFILSHGRSPNYLPCDFTFLTKIPMGPKDSMTMFRFKLGWYYPITNTIRVVWKKLK